MPVIVFASSKGGPGKTTASILVASELCRQGLRQDISVTLVDADPNQHSAAWANKDGRPSNLHLIERAHREDRILEAIEEGARQSKFVVVDLEGTASMTVGLAISRADLVIIPCQGSRNDAAEAIKTVKVVSAQSKVMNRNIHYALFMNRTSLAIISRGYKDITKQLNDAGMSIMETALVDREAFRSIYSFGGIVNDLPTSDVAGVDKAAKNAFAFTAEIVGLLKKALKKKNVGVAISE